MKLVKRNILMCIGSVVLAVFLAVTLCIFLVQAKNDTYRGFKITINNQGQPEFVTAEEIDKELGYLSKNISKYPIDSINTLEIERRIMSFDNVEKANCVVLCNREVSLEVVPMIPVARVFDYDKGTSYYLNRAGKTMSTNLKCRLDVPVIFGNFSEKSKASDAIPVIDYIQSDPNLTSLVSAVRMNAKGDIILVPMIKGHVINFGDSTDIQNKFDRIMVFYKKVLPVKGWEYYDTISVKWRGQVVATRHDNTMHAESVVDIDDEYIDDVSTMSGGVESTTAN